MLSNSLFVAALCMAAYGAAYIFYSKYLAEKIFALDPSRKTPAHEFEDGIDHVPTSKSVLFGHHFASIAGVGPILGPAIGVFWGWLPAVIWVVVGAIFIGAVHDFATLVMSVRHQGRSISEITGDLVGARARFIFLLLSFFLLALAMGVFCVVIRILFVSNPECIVPVFSLMVIAVAIGLIVHKLKVGIVPATAVGLLLMFGTIALGKYVPVRMPDGWAISWTYILFGYAFIASVLPVWLLLQPRDYLNSYKLYIGLGLIYLGIVIYHPQITAPAIRTALPEGTPPIFPMLFITVACGAISGFHSLVSTGTTAKQLSNESHARSIGYGSMLVEGVLAIAMVLACTAAVKDWDGHYASWAGAKGLAPKVAAAVDGAGLFVSKVGIPEDFAKAFIAVVIVAFAMTTLDTGTRLLRYNVEEIGRRTKLKPLTNRYIATAVAVLAIAFFALAKVKAGVGAGGDPIYKPAGIFLWVLFGSSNQLLAMLGLLAASLYLFRRGKSMLYTFVPMIVMGAVTVTALVRLLVQFAAGGQWALLAADVIILALAGWLVVEAGIAFRRREPVPEDHEMTQDDLHPGDDDTDAAEDASMIG